MIRLLALLLLLALPAQAQIGPRLLKITQVDAEGATIGKVIDIYCPATGCQEALTLRFEEVDERFVASIEVVGRGVYLALQSRAVGITQIVEFTKGTPGPVFLATRGRMRIQHDLRFSIVRDASVRAQRGPDREGTVSSGNVFNRRRAPDVLLRVEVGAPEG